jgi:ubiquinone/menaquinone biosynthesis C-methylase UbiE
MDQTRTEQSHTDQTRTDKTDRIKAAVKQHFEESPEAYQAFESAHGWFARLTGLILEKMSLPADARILDIGCGTGASLAVILEKLPQACVWGLDISPAMLARAKASLGSSQRLHLIEGDAARLDACFDTGFDAIIYSASIFLIPDFRTSLEQAAKLLNPGASVGLTFMDGVYDTQGQNALARSDETAKTGVSLKKPVKLEAFESTFQDLFPAQLSWTLNLAAEGALLRDFFSVPAMSAGLYPGFSYPERIRKVQHLLDHLPPTTNSFRWILKVGRSTSQPAL